MVDKASEIDNLLEALEGNEITRRHFVSRAAALGFSLPAITVLLGRLTTDALASVTPKRGGTLREGYDVDFSRMDPINTSHYDTGFFALYEALVTLDPHFKAVPQIAQGWKVSRDGLTWTFTLRPNLKFHLGDPLNAQAVAAVINTVIDPKSGSPLPNLLKPVLRANAKGDRQVVVHMKHPFIDFPNVISAGYARIVSIKTRKKLGENYAKTVINGSGPFTLVDWAPGDHVRVKRWEQYPGSITPFFKNRGKAYLDGITWRYISELPSRVLAIEKGDLDTLQRAPFELADRLKKNKNLVVTVLGEPSAWYFGLNFERLEFADLRVRQAISHAIDRKALVDRVAFGLGAPTYGPLPPQDPNYNPAVEKFNAFDLAKAKSLMADAGWTLGSGGILTKGGKRFAFSILIENQAQIVQMAAIIQQELKALGMDVKVQGVDRATQFAELQSGTDSFLFRYLWPNPVDVFLFCGQTGSVCNWQKSTVPALDKAFDEYLRAPTKAALKSASWKCQVLGAEQLPWITLFSPSAVWVQRKNVRGYLVLPWNLYPYYNDVWLA